MGFASPLALLPVEIFPKVSKAECPDTLVFYNFCDPCFPLQNSICLEFLEHLYVIIMALKYPVVSQLAQEDLGAEIVWSETTFRTGNIHLMFCKRWI